VTAPTAATILVCFAVPEEAAPFRQTMANRPDSPPDILVTGMGATNARRGLLDALQARALAPKLVLTCGYAGGLDPALPRGTVVHDADPEAGLTTVLAHAGSRPATFHCATRVAITPQEKAELRRKTGADVVEMESAVIRQLCRERGIASATVRVISDAAEDSLPVDFNQLMTPDMKLQFGKLAAVLIRSPSSIPGLLRLRRHTLDAAQRLATVLAATCQALRT
jgi:nucleoside phosphorylase